MFLLELNPAGDEPRTVKLTVANSDSSFGTLVLVRQEGRHTTSVTVL